MMLETKAVFRRKETDIEPTNCVIDKIIRLSQSEFDHFLSNLSGYWGFLGDNQPGRYRCLLVVGEGQRDGILVNTEGSDYARYSAFMPNIQDFLAANENVITAELTTEHYPALDKLNNEMVAIVGFIVKHGGVASPEGRGVFDFEDSQLTLGIDFMNNPVLRSALLSMLDQRTEIRDWEIDKNKLIIYRAKTENELTTDLGSEVDGIGGLDEAGLDADADIAESISDDLSSGYDLSNSDDISLPSRHDLADPSVTMLDMYAYGYSWDGMIPLGREKALELHDAGHDIYRLFEDGAEHLVGSREDIEEYGELFGVEDLSYREITERSDAEYMGDSFEQPFQVFVLNRERYDKVKRYGDSDKPYGNRHEEVDRHFGEWLTLPAEARDLQELFMRIGIDRPSESAFTITAIRMPFQDLLHAHISKYDALGDLNYLADLMGNMTAKELDWLQGVLESATFDFDCTKKGIDILIILAEPDGASYRGITPNAYKIVEPALRGLREGDVADGQQVQRRTHKPKGIVERSSVMEQIKSARNTSLAQDGLHSTNTPPAPKANKNRGGHDL